MSTQVATINQNRPSPFAVMAGRLNLDEGATTQLMKNTLMKAKGGNAQVSDEELITFLSIANEYQLNPLSKEIYAFNNRGAIQPIVSVDGWLKIINSHKQFNGMEFVDSIVDGAITAVTCRIFRKDREHPTEVTEYMNECRGPSEPWKKWPARMLRHKATIQASRYAFGLSGIIDPDEAERYEQTDLGNKPAQQVIDVKALPDYSIDDFKANEGVWSDLIASGKKSSSDIINMVSSKYMLSETQIASINDMGAVND